ncbi:MAG: BMP family ABC transporter substrate-binding protein [Acidimicrobiales bacterium]
MGAVALVLTGTSVVAGASSRSPHVTYAKTLACEVTDTGGINDKSFNASAYLGLQEAAAVSPNIAQSVISTPSTGTESNYDSEIASFVSEKCDIIITVGFLMSDATWNAAVNNPTVHFAQVDNGDTSPGNDGIAIPPYTGTAPGNNILGLTYETQQDAFLGGYEAAAYAVLKNPKSPKVATYGGEQFSSVTYYMDGFYDGVQYYNTKMKKNVQVLGWNEKTQKGTFIGSFTDTATARTDTTAFLSQGATTIFPVAGSDGLGTTSAVRTWNAAHKLKANVEWVDTDGCISDAPDCNLFLNSVTKGVTASVKAAVLEQASGQFAGGDYIGTLANGGAAFIQDSQSAMAKQLPKSVLTAVATITKGIESGSIKVPVGGK